MEQNSFQRKIGIALGIFVIVAVAGVTAFYEVASSSASSALSAGSALSTTNSANSISSTPLTNSTVTSVPTQTASNESTDQGSDESSENRTSSTRNTSLPITAPIVPTPPPAIVPKQTASTYKNGTYAATGSYQSPGGEEQIKVTLTLSNDVITNASVTSLAYDRTSQRYQNMFISGYKQYVVGQKIASVNLTYVSGSSLTPQGFDNALSQIMSQAKA